MVFPARFAVLISLCRYSHNPLKVVGIRIFLPYPFLYFEAIIVLDHSADQPLELKTVRNDSHSRAILEEGVLPSLRFRRWSLEIVLVHAGFGRPGELSDWLNWKNKSTHLL